MNPEAQLELLLRRAEQWGLPHESTADDGAERLDSYGHRVAQNALVDSLMRQGLAPSWPLAGKGKDAGRDLGIRDNRAQVIGVGGRRVTGKGGNIPDVSYVSNSNRRVNVEIDTDEDNTIEHLKRLRSADPNSIHIGFVVDQKTGQVKERYRYDPKTKSVRKQKPSLRLPAPKVPSRSNPQKPPKPPQFTYGLPRRAWPRRASREAELEAMLDARLMAL